MEDLGERCVLVTRELLVEDMERDLMPPRQLLERLETANSAPGIERKDAAGLRPRIFILARLSRDDYNLLMDRRTYLKTVVAAGAGAGVSAAQGKKPIILYCDLQVDPAREKEMTGNFHNTFEPVIKNNPASWTSSFRSCAAR